MKKIFLKIGVSALLFFLLSRLVDFGELKETISNADPLFFVLGVLVVALNYAIGALRWKILIGDDPPGFKRVQPSGMSGGLNPIGGLPASNFLTLLKFYFLGGFFNNFMPSSIGGDAYKIYRLGKELHDPVRAAAATFMDRFTGIVALFSLSSFGLISFWGVRGLGALILFIVTVIFGLWFLKFIASWHPVLAKFQKIIYSYKDQRGVLAKSLLLSFGVQVCSIGAELLAFRSLGIYPPLGQAVFFLPLINFAAFLPVSFNGLGVQDGLFIFAFSKVGIRQEAALSVSVTYHFMRFMVSLVGGLIYTVESFGSPSDRVTGNA